MTSEGSKRRDFLSLVFKSVLYGIWKFRNKATFHNGKESDQAITRYIIQDVTSRIKLDHFCLPAAKFDSLWVHPELCRVLSNNRLVFPFINH